VLPRKTASCDWGIPVVGVDVDKLVGSNGEAKMDVVVSMCVLLERVPMDRKVTMDFYAWDYRSTPSTLYETVVSVLVCEQMASHGCQYLVVVVFEEFGWVVVGRSWVGVCSLRNTLVP
jgi:hypothetical protein